MRQYSDDCQSAGEQFLSFTIRFFNLIKASYQQHNQTKANTVAFHAMVRLNQPDTQAPTMSELAKELDIPKQQLTKLVNGLESKGLVKRQHDSVNRRQVHLYITPSGSAIMHQLKQAMLDCTVTGLTSFSKEELYDLTCCLERLSQLLKKFRPEPPDETAYRNFPNL